VCVSVCECVCVCLCVCVSVCLTQVLGVSIYIWQLPQGMPSNCLAIKENILPVDRDRM
jgi:hypothetical protein